MPANVTNYTRPKMGLVEGSRPRFSDETAGLLRERLTAASLVLSVILALAFVSNLFAQNVPLVGVRAAVLAILIGSWFLLRSSRSLSLVQLRGTELLVFGVLMLHLLLMMRQRLLGFAVGDDPDFASAVAAKHGYLAAWTLLIMTYGVLMPNTWKRGLAVLLPVACLPYLMLFWVQRQVPAVATALEADHLGSAVPLPLAAVLVAVFSSYTINAIRKEAFQSRQLGQYRLKRKLGAGGMGEVHEAEHQLLKRPCAIKLIHPSKATDAGVLERFEREVQATAKLTHWNTVEIYDYGHTDDGRFYYVMEQLPGLSMEQLVKQHGPLPPERVVHFSIQCCDALRESHAKGLIHRDIKPANLFAAERGGVYDVAKLLDFGLVREQRSQKPDGKQAAAGSFSGSPHYMCPEQAKSYDKVDARGDIYSLGAVGYFALTGQPPFSGESAWDVILAHAQQAVKPPSAVNPAVPQDLEQVILRCLEKRPEDRFQYIDALSEALSACQCAGRWSDADARAWWWELEHGRK